MVGSAGATMVCSRAERNIASMMPMMIESASARSSVRAPPWSGGAVSAVWRASFIGASPASDAPSPAGPAPAMGPHAAPLWAAVNPRTVRDLAQSASSWRQAFELVNSAEIDPHGGPASILGRALQEVARLRAIAAHEVPLPDVELRFTPGASTRPIEHGFHSPAPEIELEHRMGAFKGAVVFGELCRRVLPRARARQMTKQGSVDRLESLNIHFDRAIKVCRGRGQVVVIEIRKSTIGRMVCFPRLNTHCFAVVGDRAIRLALGEPRAGAQAIGLALIRVDPDGVREVGDGAVVLAFQVPIAPTQHVRLDIRRLDPNDLRHVGNGAVGVVQQAPGIGTKEVGVRMIGVEPDRLAVIADRAPGAAEAVVPGAATLEIGIGEIRIELDGLVVIGHRLVVTLLFEPGVATVSVRNGLPERRFLLRLDDRGAALDLQIPIDIGLAGAAAPPVFKLRAGGRGQKQGGDQGEEKRADDHHHAPTTCADHPSEY